MERIGATALDIAKNVFQVHGIDETGTVASQRRPIREPVGRTAAGFRPFSMTDIVRAHCLLPIGT